MGEAGALVNIALAGALPRVGGTYASLVCESGGGRGFFFPSPKRPFFGGKGGSWISGSCWTVMGFLDSSEGGGHIVSSSKRCLYGVVVNMSTGTLGSGLCGCSPAADVESRRSWNDRVGDVVGGRSDREVNRACSGDLLREGSGDVRFALDWEDPVVGKPVLRVVSKWGVGREDARRACSLLFGDPKVITAIGVFLRGGLRFLGCSWGETGGITGCITRGLAAACSG